jgi:hypothetical protein
MNHGKKKPELSDGGGQFFRFYDFVTTEKIAPNVTDTRSLEELFFRPSPTLKKNTYT